MDMQDKKAFGKLVGDTFAAYGKALPEGALMAAWWNELNMFPLPVVAMAFAAHKDENGEFAPVPAGIAKRCKMMDGRPGAEEAWAMIPMDQQTSVVWTDEMAGAWGVVESLLNDGDRIAARMAFKETYTRLVKQSRDAGVPIRWTLAQGMDKNGRQSALIEAVRKRRMSLDAAVSLLPPEHAQGLLLSLGVKTHPLLAPPSKEGQLKVKALLSQLRLGQPKDAA